MQKILWIPNYYNESISTKIYAKPICLSSIYIFSYREKLIEYYDKPGRSFREVIQHIGG